MGEGHVELIWIWGAGVGELGPPDVGWRRGARVTGFGYWKLKHSLDLALFVAREVAGR